MTHFGIGQKRLLATHLDDALGIHLDLTTHSELEAARLSPSRASQSRAGRSLDFTWSETDPKASKTHQSVE